MIAPLHRNIYGEPLHPCCASPATGFTRNGRCEVPEEDHGLHAVCAEVTGEFLRFTRDRGNDLATPRPDFAFPGLKPGDRWCLCAARWLEAHEAGVAPLVDLRATHERALDVIPRELLEAHALPED